jgi:hypothetical protein
MSHTTTKDHEPAHASGTTTHGSSRVSAGTRTAAPRDAAADQARLLGLLAADWLNGDRTHAAEIAALLAAMTSAVGPAGLFRDHLSLGPSSQATGSVGRSRLARGSFHLDRCFHVGAARQRLAGLQAYSTGAW